MSEPTLEEATAFLQNGQLAQAKAVSEHLLVKEPDNADNLHLLGVIEFQTNNLQRATQLINQALALTRIARLFMPIWARCCKNVCSWKRPFNSMISLLIFSRITR